MWFMLDLLLTLLAFVYAPDAPSPTGQGAYIPNFTSPAFHAQHVQNSCTYWREFGLPERPVGCP